MHEICISSNWITAGPTNHNYIPTIRFVHKNMRWFVQLWPSFYRLHWIAQFPRYFSINFPSLDGNQFTFAFYVKKHIYLGIQQLKSFFLNGYTIQKYNQILTTYIKMINSPIRMCGHRVYFSFSFLITFVYWILFLGFIYILAGLFSICN